MKQRIELGTGNWTGYEPLYLASRLKYIDSDKISINRYNSEIDVIMKMIDGSLNGAALTLNMFFTLIEAGIDLKAVCILDYSAGGDVIITEDNIESVDELRGQNIGMPKSYICDFFLARALAEHNITASEVELIYMNKKEQDEALRNGDVAACVNYFPAANYLLGPGRHILFSSKLLPASIIDILVFNSNTLKNQKEDIAELISAWFQSLDYIEKNYQLAMREMAHIEGTDEYDFKVNFDYLEIPNYQQNMMFFNMENDKNIFKLSDIVRDFMRKKKLIKRDFNTNELFDISVLESIGYR